MRSPILAAAAALLAVTVSIRAAAGPAAPAIDEQPSAVIQSAAQQILKALDADREGYRKNPAKIQEVVDRYLLPHFDTRLAAQSVLGRYWRTATPAQRRAFIDAFIHSMLDHYGRALLDQRPLVRIWEYSCFAGRSPQRSHSWLQSTALHW